MATPDIAHRGLAEPLALGHLSTTPLGHSMGLGLESGGDDGLNFLWPVSRLATPAGRDLPHTLQTVLGETRPPQNDRGATDLEIGSNLWVGLTLGRRQNDAAAQCDLLRGSLCVHPAQKLLTLLWG